jgi:hypothetical protein
MDQSQGDRPSPPPERREVISGEIWRRKAGGGGHQHHTRTRRRGRGRQDRAPRRAGAGLSRAAGRAHNTFTGKLWPALHRAQRGTRTAGDPPGSDPQPGPKEAAAFGHLAPEDERNREPLPPGAKARRREEDGGRRTRADRTKSLRVGHAGIDFLSKERREKGGGTGSGSEDSSGLPAPPTTS